MSRKVFEEHSTTREDLLLDEFINLAINRFTWSNLPQGVTSERLEEMLICHGVLGAFKSEVDEIVILPCFGTSNINLYNEHTEYHLNGYNGKNYNKKAKEVVRLKNNPLGSEDLSTLQLYAKRIDDIEMTQEVNLFQQNIPKIMTVTKDSILSAKNIMQQLKDFKFVIFKKASKTSTLNNDEVLDNSSPYLLDKLSDYENFYRNKVLTYLGINNNNINKKERLVVDEVNSNNEYIQISLDLCFDMREKFCKEVNEKFGCNIKVEKREVEQVEEIDNRDPITE